MEQCANSTHGIGPPCLARQISCNVWVSTIPFKYPRRMAYIYGHPAPSWKMVAPDGRATALLVTALPHRRLLLYFQKYLPAPPNFPSSHPPRLPIAVPNFPRLATFLALLKVPFPLLVSFGFRAGFVRVSCRLSPKLHRFQIGSCAHVLCPSSLLSFFVLV